MDSYEFSQWIAFEQAHGPLGGEWTNEAIAGIHEQLQTIAYLLGQAHFTDKQHKNGPVPKPEHLPRANEYNKPPPSIVDNLDEAEWLPLTEDELLDVKIDPTETGEED